jgi:hypothetical protein
MMPPDSAVDLASDATLAALGAGPHPSQVRLKFVRADRESPGQLHPIEESGLTHRAQPPSNRAGAEVHVAGEAALGDASEAGVALVGHQLPARVRLLLERERYLASRAATLRAALDWSLELHAAALDNPGGKL